MTRREITKAAKTAGISIDRIKLTYWRGDIDVEMADLPPEVIQRNLENSEPGNTTEVDRCIHRYNKQARKLRAVLAKLGVQLYGGLRGDGALYYSNAAPTYTYGSKDYTCPKCGAEVDAFPESDTTHGEHITRLVYAVRGFDGSLWFRFFRLRRANWELVETDRLYYGQGSVKRWIVQPDYNHKEERIASKTSIPYFGREYQLFRGNFDGLFDGTPLQYSDFMIASCIYNEPMEYAVQSLKYPAIEQLHKHGLCAIVNYCLNKERDYYGNRKNVYYDKLINLKAKRGRDIFQFPYWVLKRYKPPEWTLSLIETATALFAPYPGVALPPTLTNADRLQLLDLNLKVHDELIHAGTIMLTYNMSASKLCGYLRKQHTTNTGDYLDYLNECAELGYDLSLERIRFPDDLQEAHRETSANLAEPRGVRTLRKPCKTARMEQKRADDRRCGFGGGAKERGRGAEPLRRRGKIR